MNLDRHPTSGTESPGQTRPDAVDLYRRLYLIRRVEEEIARVYPTDKIKSPVHLSIGQEAVAVGVCANLGPDDIVFCSYRGHAAYLAKGGDLRRMIAELYGKATGCGRGKGGSMHLIDVAHGIMGTSAVVGTTIPQAVGYAYALRYQRRNSATRQGRDQVGWDSVPTGSGQSPNLRECTQNNITGRVAQVVVCFFGDGATEEGVFCESLNFAALKRLPVIFVCENNQYAIHTHQLRRQPQANICQRVQAYGIPSACIGDDVFRVRDQVGDAVRALRSGAAGPFFFECLTYRWQEHVGPNEDFQLGYRTREEAEPWFRNDQVARLAQLLPDEPRQCLEQEVDAEIRDAFAFAEASPFPDPAELFTDVFKTDVVPE